jgi:hypothetical protein
LANNTGGGQNGPWVKGRAVGAVTGLE